MTEPTSIGPDGALEPPSDRETRPTTEGVDAQNANEFDSQHALGGVEAKPFSPPASESDRLEQPKRGSDSEDHKSNDDLGLASERRTAARDDGVNSASAE